MIAHLGQSKPYSQAIQQQKAAAKGTRRGNVQSIAVRLDKLGRPIRNTLAKKSVRMKERDLKDILRPLMNVNFKRPRSMGIISIHCFKYFM